MTTIVVGGHSRNVGKTSVVAGLIAAFSQYSWTALKISSHWHADSASLEDENKEDVCHIHEECNRDGRADTSRFLAAGAARSFWVRVREGRLEAAMPRLLPILQSNPFVIIESNAILQYIQPDLYIMVLRFDVEDFKESARVTLPRAHAAVAVNYGVSMPAWKGISCETISRIPLYPTTDPQIIPIGLIDLAQAHLHL